MTDYSDWRVGAVALAYMLVGFVTLKLVPREEHGGNGWKLIVAFWPLVWLLALVVVPLTLVGKVLKARRDG